jgi:hypothetical protein
MFLWRSFVSKEIIQTTVYLYNPFFVSHAHVVPPQSSSATYRLSSVQRGAQGFVEFERETAEWSAAGGIRLSLGLQDWRDMIADLQDALEVV